MAANRTGEGKVPTKQFSADARDLPMVERVIEKLTGLLQDLRDRKERCEPMLAMPAVYVAAHLACSTGSVKRWIKQHNALYDTNDISARFIDVYTCIADELAESLSAKTLKIAHSTEHPHAFAAQKFILPIMSPHVFGGAEIESAKAAPVSEHPQEVYDELRPAENAEIAKLDAEIQERNRRFDELLADAAKRRAAREADDP